MAYIIFGICAALCIIVVVLCYRIIKENRKFAPKIEKEDEDEIWS